MTGRERRYSMLLRSYPRAYRDERGDELLGTLLDASASQGTVRNIGDAIDLVVHGLQLRAGLRGDRYAGRVLDKAGLPGLVMAATLAVVAFVLGEWVPTLTHQAIRLGFGPFMTMGPALYLVWVLGALIVLARPRFQRPVAIICVLATLSFVPVSDALRYGRPPGILLVVLIGLGLPSVLAPEPARGTHTTKAWSLVAACVVVAATLSLLNEFQGVGPRSDVFYWKGLRHLPTWMPIIALGVLVLICGVLVLRRTDLAGAIALLALPWTFTGVVSPFGFSSLAIQLPATTMAINAALCASLATGLLVGWIADLRRPSRPGLGSSGLDGSLNLGS